MNNPEPMNHTEDRPPQLQIGGMALENGVMFHSRRYWTMGVTGPDGRIRVVSGEKLKLAPETRLRKIPLLRGLINMAETVVILPRVHAGGGRLPFQTQSPQVLASVIVSLLGTVLVRKSTKKLSPLVEELAISALALVPSLVALRKTRAVQYHAAEHKSINAYETTGAGGAINGNGVLGAEAEHPRCGSNVVGPALAMMTAGNALVRHIKRRQSSASRLGIGILSFTGAIEAVQWAARHPHNRWSRLLTVSGSGLQHLFTTAEPTEDQVETSLAALRELLRLEGALGQTPG